MEPKVAVEFIQSSITKKPSFGITPISKLIRVTGPLGSLDFPMHHGLKVSIDQGKVAEERELRVALDEEVFPTMSKYCQKFVRAMWGTTTSILRQNVEGVTEGYQVSLRLVGVGYKATIEKNAINLKAGYTHEILLPVPTGVTATTPISTKILLTGTNYQQLTQFAAKIRAYRKPEPYNGKGIFVGNETITLKEGKKK